MLRGLVSGLTISVVLSAAVAVAAPPPDRPPDRGNGGGGPRSFDVAGSVHDLVPTVPRDLPVRIEIPYRFAVEIVTLEVDVGDPPGSCDASHLDVVLPDLPIPVPRRGEVTVHGSATLAADAPDACQGAVWPLTWTAAAERP